MTRSRLLATTAAASLLASACAVYNDECTPVVADPGRVVGAASGDITVARADVRSDDARVGQIVADAFLHATADRGQERSLRAHLAVVNAGDIRDDGVCGVRYPAIRQGPVTRKDLRTVLPFDNALYLVALTPAMLKDVLEHAYARMADRSAAYGAFLQISGARVEVDCAQAAESVTAGVRRQGARVRAVALCAQPSADACTAFDGLAYRGDGGPLGWDLDADPAVPVPEGGVVRLLTTDFLLSAGQNDGFVDLAGVKERRCVPTDQPTNMPCVLRGTDLGATAFDGVERWFAANAADGLGGPPQDRVVDRRRGTASACPQ